MTTDMTDPNHNREMWNPVLDLPLLVECLKRRLTMAADEHERAECQALLEDAESCLAEARRG